MPSAFVKKRVLVAGGAGFIGSHIAMRLKKMGHTVVVADQNRNQYMPESEFCDEFIQVRLPSSIVFYLVILTFTSSVTYESKRWRIKPRRDATRYTISLLIWEVGPFLVPF